jgi:ribosomal protein S18 acetylase RimI-like enzyme
MLCGENSILNKNGIIVIRLLVQKDREKILAMLENIQYFTAEEIDVAMELVDIVLRDEKQRDYTIQCLVDHEDQPLGYVCYGPTPMTERTFDLYWIVVDPQYQSQGVGTKLLDFFEDTVRGMNGRMILIDTSSISPYEGVQRFYSEKGYREVARVPDYYWSGNDRITFCKKLRDEAG